MRDIKIVKMLIDENIFKHFKTFDETEKRFIAAFKRRIRKADWRFSVRGKRFPVFIYFRQVPDEDGYDLTHTGLEEFFPELPEEPQYKLAFIENSTHITWYCATQDHKSIIKSALGWTNSKYGEGLKEVSNALERTQKLF